MPGPDPEGVPLVDVILALLHDRATYTGGVLRCAVIQNPRGAVSKARTSTGEVRYSTELVCRVASAPAIGTVLTVGGTVGAVGHVAVMDTTGPWMRHARVYVTSRLDVTGPLTGTATFHPTATTTDAYSTVRRVPTGTPVTAACRLEPVGSSEDLSDGQRRAQAWTLTADGDLLAAGVDAYATVTVSGITYALAGDPTVRADGVGGWYSTAVLRRVGDGTA